MNRVTWEPGMASLGSAVAAIGVFDGVHLGHRALVADAVSAARAADRRAVVVTFDIDPDRVVTPDRAAPQLLDLDEKLRYLSELGPDHVLVVPFTPQLAALKPDAFVERVLLGAMSPATLMVGCDFRYGAAAAGTVDTLAAAGDRLGFTVVAHELVTADGAPITSTRIRGLVATGDVAGAAGLLGRPHRVAGRVGHGRGEGAELDAPTANVRPAPWAAIPADGVYAGRVTVDGRVWPAGVSVGVPPSFPDAVDILEAHLIGFRGDLYGRVVTIEFLERIREQRAFADPAELGAAIRADLAAIERVARGWECDAAHEG